MLEAVQPDLSLCARTHESRNVLMTTIFRIQLKPQGRIEDFMSVVFMKNVIGSC